ncbi:hypothetical protein HAX54_048324, partial [Datura stramonium]|nr:hypothetical protein [Datura stramonium]
PHCTGTPRVKTDEMSVWCRMNYIFPVHCEGQVANRYLVGLHLRSSNIPPVLPALN